MDTLLKLLTSCAVYKVLHWHIPCVGGIVCTRISLKLLQNTLGWGLCILTIPKLPHAHNSHWWTHLSIICILSYLTRALLSHSVLMILSQYHMYARRCVVSQCGLEGKGFWWLMVFHSFVGDLPQLVFGLRITGCHVDFMRSWVVLYTQASGWMLYEARWLEKKNSKSPFVLENMKITWSKMLMCDYFT